MLGWLKNINKKIKDLNISVDNYKKETDNQTMPVHAYINRAKKMIDRSMFLEARDVLNEALSISQKDALIYKYLGICEEKLGNFEGAVDMFQKSASINPQDKNIWHKLGMTQITLKKYEEAEKSFEEANKISPMNTDIQTGWGMSLLKQKKHSQAHEKFVKAIQINSYNFSAMLLCAIVEIRIKKYNEAEQKLLFLMDANPTEGAAYEYANLCHLKENLNGAIRYAQKSIELNPNMLPAYLLLGEVYSQMFDYKNSVKYFSTAEELKLTSSILYINWGNALMNLYKFEEAKEMFQKALLTEPESVDAQAGMALCCAETQNFERMHSFISFVEEKGEEFATIEISKGITQATYGNIENAVEIFKKVLNSYPKEIYTYYRLAKCYEKLQKTDMVKDSYDKFIKLNPNYATAYLDYAKFLISMKDYKDAQRKLRKAEKLDSNNQEILNLLFYTSYILVKDNLCEYNIKEAISIADKIEDFQYPELREELETLLKDVKEN